MKSCAVFFALALAVGAPAVAFAAGSSSSFGENPNWPKPQFRAHVESRPDGVYVHISATEAVQGSSAVPQPVSAQPAPVASAAPRTAVAATSKGTSWTDDFGYHYRSNDGHTQDLTPENISSVSQNFWRQQFAQHPNQVPYNLIVDQQYQGFVWLPYPANGNVYIGPAPQAPPNTPGAGNGGSTNPYQVAVNIETHIPLPSIRLEMNPNLGLVAMPGWFWVDGYDGRPFGGSRTVTIPPAVPGGPSNSFTVTVRIWGNRYEWNFGDGTSPIEGSLGKPYPQQSDIQHSYQFSSFGLQSGFDVLLTVQFAAQYQINGGAPRGLPPIQHTYRATHLVQEVQTTLSAPQRP
ncbi:MAG TPA: hypothetical protein VMW62_04305 [Chloroflexota bacterium]|nr:hypothetical protein [Chloroflexota bacterium]